MAETDMVTKVARAICESHGENPDEMVPGVVVTEMATGEHLFTFGGPLEPSWHKYVRTARAAIAALREPSKKMLVAGEDAFEEFKDETEDSDAEGNRHVSFFYHAGVEAHVWQSMIDAALATPQTEKDE